MEIVVVGLGVIGKAVESLALSRGFNVTRVDPKFSDAITLEQALERNPVAVFICLPTPSRTDGSCDVSILESALETLSGFDLPVVSHSTAPWALYSYWATRIPNLVHVPEFVTAAGAQEEYANQHRVIVGGSHAATANAMPLLLALLPNISEIHQTTISEAAFIKYMTNCFLAMKVIFANQMQELSSTAGMNWDVIWQMAAQDSRMGHTHWMVPGPDGQRGYGGMCFPKDVDAMLTESDRLGIGLSLLEETKKANAKIRN